MVGRVPQAAFRCGEGEIDTWLLKAHREHDKLRTRVTTAHLEEGDALAAFYGLRIAIESDKDIDGNDGFRVENGVFAAVQLCYVATQLSLQARGVGGVVMLHAMRDFAEVAKLTGICAMTLVAINERRAQWYEALGFSRYGKPRARPKMFLPAKSAIELVG